MRPPEPPGAPVSDPTPLPTPDAPAVTGRIAATVLGSMLLLIAILTLLLVQTTWADSAGMGELPTAVDQGFAQR